jgi:hypothetical protein
MTTPPQHSDELEKLLIITFANMMIGKDYPNVDQLVAATMPLFTAELKKREAAASHEAKSDEVDIDSDSSPMEQIKGRTVCGRSLAKTTLSRRQAVDSLDEVYRAASK